MATSEAMLSHHAAWLNPNGDNILPKPTSSPNQHHLQNHHPPKKQNKKQTKNK
jgi:hypothetical protein